MQFPRFRFVIIGICVMAASFALIYILETNTLAAIDLTPAQVDELKSFYNFMRGIGVFIGAILIVIGFAKKNKAS